MTTESNHNDLRVSEAYQGLATETTPPELDRKILAMAAGKSRYGLARAWIRPAPSPLAGGPALPPRRGGLKSGELRPYRFRLVEGGWIADPAPEARVVVGKQLDHEGVVGDLGGGRRDPVG